MVTYSSVGETLRQQTVLSDGEIWNVERVNPVLEALPFQHAYIGNIAVKSYIPAEYRGKLNESEDTDVIMYADDDTFFDTIDPSWEVEAVRPIRRETNAYGVGKGKERRTYDPFEFFKTEVPVDHKKLDMDVYTSQTGVTFVPVNDEDRDLVEERSGIYVPDLGFVAATHLNPFALTHDRVRRLHLALEPVVHGEPQSPSADTVQQRFYDKMREGFLAAQYNPELSTDHIEQVSQKAFNQLEHTENPRKAKGNIEAAGLIDVYARVLDEQGIEVQRRNTASQ